MNSVISTMVSLCILVLPATVFAQGVPNPRNLNGVWQAPFTTDLARVHGAPLPMTPQAEEIHRNVDSSKDPAASRCLPTGPTRAIQSPNPFQILQGENEIALLFEYQGHFRVIYMDPATTHPEDVLDYPGFQGHSIGKWEGNILVVDTVGIDERTWLDTSGHPHSVQLRVTERFEKTDANTIKWTVTYDDPVFYTKPWTVSLDLKRQNTRLMSFACNDNNIDAEHMQPFFPNQNR
jgi:hypothetical protein